MSVAALIVDYLRALAWPVVTFAIVWQFRREIKEVFQRIRRANIPGGVSLDLSERIEEAKVLSEKIEASPAPVHRPGPSIPLTEANARMIGLGLAPSPSGLNMGYYADLAAMDPTLALAGLRIEIDVLAKNLSRGFSIQIDKRESTLRLLKRLFEKGAISADQLQLAGQVLHLCNAAIHGEVVSREQALAVIDVARVLAEQYLDWLSWGFQDGWAPTHSAHGSSNQQ